MTFFTVTSVTLFTQLMNILNMSDTEKPISIDLITQKTEWAQLTMAQLHKDAELSGTEWNAEAIPQTLENWISHIINQLKRMEKANPEILTRFLYRIDLPEREGIQEINEQLALAILKRAFLKVWFKANYTR